MSVYKVIGKYTKTGDLKFISHLDVLRMMQRAVSRAGLPAKYSEGFNPHIRLTFGFPLSLGVESVGEYFELELTERVDEQSIISLLNEVLPEKVKVLNAMYYTGKESLMTMCKFSEYLLTLEFNEFDIDVLSEVSTKITSEGIIFERHKKGKSKKPVVKEINTKDYIHYLKIDKVNDNTVRAEIVIKTSGDGSMKIAEFVKVIEDNIKSEVAHYSAMKIESLNENSKPIIV